MWAFGGMGDGCPRGEQAERVRTIEASIRVDMRRMGPYLSLAGARCQTGKRRAIVGRMAVREKLRDESVALFLKGNEGWALEDGAVRRIYTFPSYAEGIAFAVRLAFLAEARDHHPDILITWRHVKVGWWTHDAGGITALDLELALVTDELVTRR